MTMVLQASLEPTLLWQEGAVKVWLSPIHLPPDALDVLRQTLSANEHERAARYRLAQMSDAFIVRRGLLRVLLAKELDCCSSSLHFEYNQFGKPFLASRDLFFSVSSSRDYSVWAFSSQLPIGVDIEWLDPEMPLTAVVNDHFSQTERRRLFAMQEIAKRTEAFFLTWTVKEACAKAAGIGLSAPLDQYVVLDAIGTTVKTKQGAYSVKSLQCTPKPEKAVYQVSFALARFKR